MQPSISRQSPHRRSLHLERGVTREEAMQAAIDSGAIHTHAYRIGSEVYRVATEKAYVSGTHRFFFTVTDGKLKGAVIPAKKWHQLEQAGVIKMVEAGGVR